MDPHSPLAQRDAWEAEAARSRFKLTLDAIVAAARDQRSPARQAQERARRVVTLAFELGALATSQGAATETDLRLRWPDLDALLPDARRLAQRLFPQHAEAA